jgi:hypothetical protein
MTTDQTPTRDRRILLAWLWYMALWGWWMDN